MKYHTTFSTIVISLVVLLVFSVVALGTVIILSMTSPTLITTNIILDSLSEMDTSISVSFDSMERNFRDGVFINGLKIGYDGEEIVSFDRITVHMGLFSLIRYIALGNGKLNVEASNGSINIPPSFLERLKNSGEREDNPSFDYLSILDNYAFSIFIHDIDMNILDIVTVYDFSLMTELEYGLDGINGRFQTETMEIDYENLNGRINRTVVDFSYDDVISLNAAIDEITGNYDDIEFIADSLFANASISLADDFNVEARVEVDSVEASRGDDFISIAPLWITLDEYGIELSLSSLSASYDDFSGSLGYLKANLAENVPISIHVDELDVNRGELNLIKMPSADIVLDKEGKNAKVSSPVIETGGLSYLTNLFPKLTLTTFELDAKESNGDLNVIISSSALMDSEEIAFDGTTLDLETTIRLKDGKPSWINTSLNNIHLPGIEDFVRLNLFYDNGQFRLNGSYGTYLSLLAKYDKSLSLSLYSNDLALYPLRNLISYFMPLTTGYIGTDTSITGSVNIDVTEADGGMTGPLSLALSFDDIRFNEYSFDLAVNLSAHLMPDTMIVRSSSIHTDLIDVSWIGSIDLERMLPDGNFEISRSETGKAIANVLLTLSDSREYSFLLTSPLAPLTRFSGRVDFSEEELVRSNALLVSGDSYYPIDFSVNLAENQIKFENPALSINVKYGDEIAGTAIFSSFPLPVPSTDVTPCTLSGTINLSFIFSEQSLSLTIPTFRIVNMRHLPTSPDLSFSAYGNNDSIRIENIIFSGIETEPLRGALELSASNRSIALYLSSTRGNNRETIRVSILAEDSQFSGIFRADNFNLSRIGIDSLVADINLTGNGESFRKLAFSGTFTAKSKDMINNPADISASMYVNSTSLELRNIKFDRGGISVTAPAITFDSTTGNLGAHFDLAITIDHKDRSYPITTSLDIEGQLSEDENLFRTIIGLSRENIARLISANISVGTTNIDNRLYIEPRNTVLTMKDRVLYADGSLLTGSFDVNNNAFDANIDLDPVLNLNLKGEFYGDDFTIKAEINNFEISFINLLFPVPTVIFYDPSPVSGELYVAKNGIEWDLYGRMDGESVAFDLFWIPNERIILHNPSIVIWDNSITSLIDDCTALNLETFEQIPARAAISADLSSTLSLLQWSVDVYIEDGNEVGIRLPIVASNVDIWGDVSGNLSIVGQDMNINLEGEITAENLRMSIGMEPLPEWWGSKRTTTMDMNILLRENVSFVLPLGPNPIFTAFIAENQRLHVSKHSIGGLNVTGTLDIRSGEFYYFQKNFYITEGNISFPTTLYGEAEFNPTINLRARLRDFDTEGQPVDIYLILRNATLDNITPSFESSPSKNINEIMTILGGSILPTGVYGDISISSMFSLLSASVDILTRMGILRSTDTGLEQSIRTSLSLDTFSIHTNIVGNILYDTVNLASSNLDSENLSPMARYLDGTTLYLGKYITPEVYFEAMVHLQSSTDWEDSSPSFIADDLDLDIEISLEWTNPLCTVSFFTQPDNITLYDIMDNFGFEISKRIVW